MGAAPRPLAPPPRRIRPPLAPLPRAGAGIRKASLFFGGRREKRLGRISPPQIAP